VVFRLFGADCEPGVLFFFRKILWRRRHGASIFVRLSMALEIEVECEGSGHAFCFAVRVFDEIPAFAGIYFLKVFGDFDEHTQGCHRLISVDEKNIYFRYLDYRDGKNKIMQLDGSEFLRRFCMHILPKNFVRIRHYGILSSTGRKRFSELRSAFGLFPVSKRTKKDWKQICREQLNYDPDICPHCQKGIMKTFDSWSPGRPPPAFLSRQKTHHNSIHN
jgi:hypothetical protein